MVVLNCVEVDSDDSTCSFRFTCTVYKQDCFLINITVFHSGDCKSNFHYSVKINQKVLSVTFTTQYRQNLLVDLDYYPESKMLQQPMSLLLPLQLHFDSNEMSQLLHFKIINAAQTTLPLLDYSKRILIHQCLESCLIYTLLHSKPAITTLDVCIVDNSHLKFCL